MKWHVLAFAILRARQIMIDARYRRASQQEGGRPWVRIEHVFADGIAVALEVLQYLRRRG